jgi:hypothetical protein
MAAIEHNESFSGGGGQLSLELADKIAASILRQFDPRNGGFGSQPKFPHPGALDLLLHVGINSRQEQSSKQDVEKSNGRSTERQGTTGRSGLQPRLPQIHQNKSGALAPEVQAFSSTLEHMARGGVYDQLAGGFHRYSVDEHWRVPHFEKMLYDNTELLRNYLHGYQSLAYADFAREDFRRIAEEIAAWLLSTMSDSDRGGFYASQDADINLDDDGNYFTWTLAEARLALLAANFSPEDVGIALRYWDIGEIGDMHHDPARNVLHVKQTIEELAAETGHSVDELRPLLDHARSTLLAARSRRPTPFIDRTLYTAWNAMAVTACLETARILKINSAHDFALLTLNRLLRKAWDGGQVLRHVIAYGEGPAEGVSQPDNVPGTLDDYAFTVHACIDAWMAGGEMSYYHAAVKLADAMIALYHDRAAGAFYDTIIHVAPLGALSARRKPLQDSPTPAGNPTAASALLRLEILSGRAEYREIAQETLASFAGIVEHFGLYAGSYGLALERLLLDPLQVVVVGAGTEADRLESLAMARFAVNRTVMRIAPERLVPGGIPEALAETLLHAPKPDGAKAWAIVCRAYTCLPPITSDEALAEALK